MRSEFPNYLHSKINHYIKLKNRFDLKLISIQFHWIYFQSEQHQTERLKSLESMMLDIQQRQNEFDHEQISIVNSSFI
jgi:hypothetical protein